MVLILCGRSCSGKDSIKNMLCKEYGYTYLPSYTDRPIRPGETNGIDYNFVSPEVFQQLKDSNFFCETTSYNVAVDNRLWNYGTARDAFKDEENNSFKIMIMNVDGLHSIKGIIPREDYCICHITSNDDTITKRLEERGDDSKEAARRMMADKKDFENFSLDVDITLPNTEEDILEKLAFDLDMDYRIWLAGKGD